ncbi:MAG: hypothetical protein Q9213_001278 [Squamulea squamosa]
MSAKVKPGEALAQPGQTTANNTIQAGKDTLMECHEDKSRAKNTQAKADESPQEKSSTQTSSALSAKARKRTKTGCLTCRRRRIKCGEERPTCNNCVKSKRNCEGYTPRVIFKDPIGARPTGGTNRDTRSLFQPDTSYSGLEAHHRPLQPRNEGQIALPDIAPQPTFQDHQMWTSMNSFDMIPAYHDRPYDTSVYTPGNLPPHVLQKIAQRNSSLDTSPVTPQIDTFAVHRTGFPPQRHGGYHADCDSGIDVSCPEFRPEWSHSSTSSTAMPITLHQAPPKYELFMSGFQQRDDVHGLSEIPFQPPPIESQHGTWPIPKLDQEPDQYWPSQLPTAAQHYYEPNQAISAMKYLSSCDQVVQQGQGHLHVAKPPPFNSQHIDTALLSRTIDRYDPTVPALYDPSPEDAEDDYFDVDSDEEQGDHDHNMSDATKSNLGLMLALSANQNDGGIRSFTSFLNEPNILSSYRPPYSASPLMDPQTARIFCHFVTATAPTLSLFNRHPANPSVMFTGASVPAYQRSLFTYTLPMMALSNQALLHSQLALASLHIARLQQTSATPSLKHYHYALRRVAKAVGHPTKRREIATLAATLLLGFFEVTTAEHNKWNSHLAGAKELILEIDFAGMTKRINAYKAETKMSRKGGIYGLGHDQHYGNQGRMFFDILRIDKDLDENLISTLMGSRTRYQEYGQVIDANEPPSHYHVPLTPKDVEKFEIQCDLFWWYAKQDMYQSLISGNRLLWSHCPPRAPVGRLDAVYGSQDHLVLLFARLTEFSARDLARKIKAQAKAGERIHQTVTQDPPSSAPSQISQPLPNSSQPMHGPPPMYGMMPAPGRIHLPPAFDQSRHDRLNEANKIVVKDAELETATFAAEREWSDIWSALDLLEQAFGLDYQPLSSEQTTPLSTPFGPALYYRTYSIACLWTLFYTARIFATRVAPGMPPAATAAAGVAAPRTAHWANTVGRIFAGMQPVSATAPLNPSHGAALMDSCMGVFHAGVQFRDAAQRGWTITKLRNIARLTGWQTSALIASGCERAWTAAAKMGKGPPYTMAMNATAKDDRVNGRGRDANLGPPNENNDRRLITVDPGTRVYWAMGILSVEEDMKQLKLD